MSAELELLERSLDATFQAAKAVLALAKEQAREMERKTTDDDEWTRAPRAKERCPVSQWSRGTIHRRSQSGEIRSKSVGGCRYYSLADVRRIFSGK